jgi:D-tyrosyl-tRNA(Tyr) deacylase
MLALIQRVNKCQVLVNKKVVGEIEKGILILLAVAPEDSMSDCQRLSERIVAYRIFEDANGKMNQSVKDVKGELLVVSQFTLLADTKKGTRPSFSKTANPQRAEELYDCMVASLKTSGLKVKTGVFKAHMILKIENDGPATFILKSK